MGKHPEHWKIDRIKDVFDDDLKTLNEKIIKELEQVQHFSIPAYDNFETPELVEGSTISSGKKVLEGTGLLFSKLNCHKPRVWLYDVRNEMLPCLASTEFLGLRPLFPEKMDLRYFKYQLRSLSFINYISVFLTSVTNSHKRINPSIFFAQNILIPPFEEQLIIADFLEQSLTEVNKIIHRNVGELSVSSNVLKTLEGSIYHKLLDYKESLIHECVTGKKSISDMTEYIKTLEYAE